MNSEYQTPPPPPPPIQTLVYIIWGGSYVCSGEIFNIMSSESLLWRRHFSANENTCTKDNELATLRKWNKCFNWLLSGLHIAITTDIALKLTKKYESVWLYLHWTNVPTMTLSWKVTGNKICLEKYLLNTQRPCKKSLDFTICKRIQHCF